MNEKLLILLIQLTLFIPFATIALWGIYQFTKPMFPTEEKK